jgi:outer membrane protein TolC
MKRGKRWRWRQWVSGTLMVCASGGLTGCVKPLYMTPETQHIASTVGLPADLETDPNAAAAPDVSDHKPPPTVLDANRDPRYMNLQEAMAIALERGTRGQSSSFIFQSLAQGSISASYNDDLVVFGGRSVQGDDAIRAFALDPAIVAADIESALSKFDTRFTTSMSWQKRDQAVANIFNNFNNGDFAAFSAGLIKPLPAGGLIGITAETNYTKLGAVPQGFAVINPSYTPSVTVRFEQPLLRDYGVDVNQLLPSHPGSTQINFRPTGGGRTEGILITRIRADQAKAEFERNVQAMIFNVETAYWNLYGRYYVKYAAEQGLHQTYVTWDQLVQLQAAGLQTKQAVAQVRAQFEQFRSRYLIALQDVLDVLESERRLRGLLGMPFSDGQRIVPADTPILAPYKPDWNTSLVEAMNNRPELRMARQQLKAEQLNVMLQQNQVRPDLRFFADYNVNGIGNRLDGSGPFPTVDAFGNVSDVPGNALGSLSLNRFSNWQLGVRFDVPLGYRDAYASLKIAQLNLARSHVVLKDQERKAEGFLTSLYQQLAAQYEQIRLQQARRIAVGTQLQGQFERVKIGKDPLIQLLDAQLSFVDSIQAESDAIVRYNIAIAGFHLAKGTVLQYNNISIADGPLPAAVQERAADHFAARTAGLKLRERPVVPKTGPEPGVALPLPGVADGPPLPEAMEPLKGDPDAPPAIVPPSELKSPTVIPPILPKDAPKDSPKDGKPVSAPLPLPGLPVGTSNSPSPMVPAAASEPTILPATPVSQYRPK